MTRHFFDLPRLMHPMPCTAAIHAVLLFAALLLSGVLVQPACAQGTAEDSLSAPPSIGIALAGGGARGFAHIGALKILDSLGIPVDYVAGTSMGGLIGALYAIGYTPAEIQELVLGISWTDLFSDTPDREYLPFYEKRLDGRYQVHLEVRGLTPRIPEGLITGQKISLLFSRLTWPYSTLRSFDDLPIPFRCVAVDLVRGEEVVFSSGSLPQAMRATMSIPSVFSPVPDGERLLVDGGILNNFPTDVVKDMGADIVIGLNLTMSPAPKEHYDNLLSILDRMTDIPMLEGRRNSEKLCDILIDQNLDDYAISDFDTRSIAGIIDRGYRAALEARDRLVALRDSLALSAPPPRVNERNASMPVLRSISVQGAHSISGGVYLAHLGMHTGDTLDLGRLERRIDELHGLGYTKSITYDVSLQHDRSADLTLHVHERSLTRLGIGLRYDDYHALVAAVGGIVTSALVPGMRLESELQFLGLTRFNARFSYPSRTLDMPVYPFVGAGFKSLPVPVYGDQGLETASFNDRAWSVEAGLGISLNPDWTLEAGLRYDWMNIAMDSTSMLATQGFAPSQDRLTSLTATLLFDHLDDALMPRKGFRLRAGAVASSEVLRSERNFLRLDVDADLYIAPWHAHTLCAGASWYEGWNDLPYYAAFRVGGPESFVGLDYMQLLGPRFVILRAAYYYSFGGLFRAGLHGNVIPEYRLLHTGDAGQLPALAGAGISLSAETVIGPLSIMYSRGPLSPRNTGTSEGRWYVTAGYRF